MDDVVARAELGERLKRAARRRGATPRAAAENLGVREQGEPEVPPDEASTRRADREEELGLVRKLLTGLHDAGFDPAQEVLGSQRLALEREGDNGPEAAADESAQLVLGLGEPSRGDRRALGLERERLAGRERVELDGGVERHGLELLLRPHLADLVRLEDEIRTARDWRDEVAWDRRRSVVRFVVGEPYLGEVEPPLCCWVDRRGVDGVQRALGERREGADALDLVAEELDPQRLPARRRVDVGDPSPQREVAALLHLVHSLVSGKGELLCERVDTRLVAGRKTNRLGSRLGRRHRLGQRRGGCAHEPAGGEHVQGAGTLADEVRGRLQSRAPVDASAGEERDLVVAQEPAGRLGSVARVGVLRREDDERSCQLLVERGDQERERRLGDASPGVGKLLEERAEALALRELANQGVEDGSVHDERRNRRSAPSIVARRVAPVREAVEGTGSGEAGGSPSDR